MKGPSLSSFAAVSADLRFWILSRHSSPQLPRRRDGSPLVSDSIRVLSFFL